MLLYQAYGLTIKSSIVLPALLIAESYSLSFSDPISVDIGKVEGVLLPVGIVNPYELRFEIKNVARYQVINGTNIIIEPICSNWDEILLYFYADCLAAILFQKNIFPFHVSGICLNHNEVLLFAAHSGVGKSSTSLILQQKGFAPFTDDTASIFFKNGKIYAYASYPMVRLSEVTLHNQNTFQSDKVDYRFEETKKLGFNFHDKFNINFFEVSGIVFLEENGNEISIESIDVINCLRLLHQNVYRSRWITRMGKDKIQFEILTKLANNLKAWKAIRPKNILTFETFASAIQDTIISKLIKIEK